MKVLFVSLGCDKNLVDSEKMIGSLKSAGYVITDDEYEAEVCVINTCCFIHDAKQESIETILRIAELKHTAKLKYLLVTGCLAERYRQDILDEIPEVDVVMGSTAYDEMVDSLSKLRSADTFERLILKSPDYNPVLAGKRVLSDINHYSYLKIAEGCNKHCTYCVIPSVKGNYRSIDFDTLLDEAKDLAEQGINELTVIAQETTLYGIDLYSKKRLPELLRELCKIDGLQWIRLMYCYPEEIDDELIETIASEDKICKYIDLPIQHASDDVLKRMGRRTNRAQIEDIIKRLRETIPNIVIRTSLIAGFPGETEEDHKQLLEFVTNMKLDRVGVFTYSKEENTPAYKMKGQVPQALKKKWRKELMLAQQKSVFEKNESLIGSEMDVIIDGRIPEDNIYVGRTYMDAPQIDGCVFLSSDRDMISGTIVRSKIVGFKDYDLIAEEITDND